MALIQCGECGKSVSTEAITCPHCGAPQQRPVPPPLPVQPNEETFYSDTAVVVTNTRVIICGTTYALRNITSVRMTFTPPRVLGAILLLIIGLIILLAALVEIKGTTSAPIGVYILGGAMIGGAILWMFNAKTTYHVNLSSAAGEVHALTSENKASIERVVVSINEAIVKYQ